MSSTTPAERLSPSDDLVQKLVFEQFPNLADREIGRHYTLHDHVAVRIGDDYGALLPTVPGRDYLYARAADLLAGPMTQWTFPCSAPIAAGQPAHGYPYHWSLVHWVSASTAAFVPLHESAAVNLGSAIRQVHVTAPPGAPESPVAATTLATLGDEWVRLLAAAVQSGAPENRVLRVDRASDLWERTLAAPMDVPLTWTHGNLEPRAVLSDRGAFAGLLIWHCFGAGDRAADIGYASNLVPIEVKRALLSGYGSISDATAARALGWQLIGALRLIEIGDPFLRRIAWERLIELDLVSEA